eukprot:g8107.t1
MFVSLYKSRFCSSRFLVRCLCSKTASPGSVETVPCGILKNQPDPPIKADEEYPDWLWKLMDRQPTFKELQERYLQSGEASLTLLEAERLSRLTRKRAIREQKHKTAKF